MTPREAIQVLREAAKRAGKETVRTPEVKKALRVLLGFGSTVNPLFERWPLDSFWDSSGVAHDIGRSQGVRAAFNGVLRQLKLPPE